MNELEDQLVEFEAIRGSLYIWVGRCNTSSQSKSKYSQYNKNNMKKCNLVIFRVYCCFGLQFWICVKKNSTHHYCTDIFLMPNFSQRHELWLHMVSAWISCKYVDNSTKMAILILSTNDKFQFLEFGLFTFNIFRPWSSRMVNFENNKQNLIYACYGK